VINKEFNILVTKLMTFFHILSKMWGYYCFCYFSTPSIEQQVIMKCNSLLLFIPCPLQILTMYAHTTELGKIITRSTWGGDLVIAMV